MKRKLWIVMALAVLTVVVWCGTAGAEYDYVNGVKYTFEIYDMPVSEFGVLTLSLDPDQTKEIKFRSENFTPTRIEVWTHDSPVTVIKKMITLPGTATSFGIPYYYGEYVDLVAYYGDGDNECITETFRIDHTPRKFIVQPTDLIEHNLTGTVSWRLNFNPSRYEITTVGYDVVARRTVHPVVCELSPGYVSVELPVDNLSAYAIHAFYTDFKGEDYISSYGFTIHGTSEPKFIGQPTGGECSPDQPHTIFWTTNFQPNKVELGYIESGIWHYVDTVPPYTYAEMMAGARPENGRYDITIDKVVSESSWQLRAYYSENACITSNIFDVTTTVEFISQPVSGEVIFGNPYTVSWETNFKPTEVVYGYIKNGTFYKKQSSTTRLSEAMSFDIDYANVMCDTDLIIRAYYKGGYKDSATFTITKKAEFLNQPQGGEVTLDHGYTVEWKTDFIPTKVAYGHLENDTFHAQKTITSGLSASMSHVLTYEDVINNEELVIRAYYNTDYKDSTPFIITKNLTGKCGNDLTATLINGVLTITGTGAMYDYSGGNMPPWYGIRTAITKVVLGDGVTYIGKQAFFDCTNLNTITVPTSVVSVGASAVLNCSSLRNVNYNGFKTQWDAVDIGGNTKLLNASISYLHRSGRLGTTDVYYELIGRDGSLWIYGSGGSTVHVTPPWVDVAQYITELRVDIDTLWEDAFCDCTGVKKVYLSESLTTVQDGAFNDCTGLTDIYYDSTTNDWDSIEILGHNAPLLNATLHTAPHEEQLTGDLSWSVNDEGLLRIWFDDSLMGDGEETAIPDYSTYTATPWYADYKDVITSLRIEDGVTSIGRYAFSHLSNLRTIDIADTVTIIGNWSFSDCTRLQDFTLPDSVTSILAYTFQNCNYLEILHLPDSIRSMGIGVFQDCGNLEKVWLPDQLTAILGNTFMNCGVLDYIYIPASVTSIGSNAFSGCDSLLYSSSEVCFGGTSAQWKAISLGTGNDALINAGVIHMTPEELRIDEANFPDAEFRGYVSTNTDADYSSWLTDEEIANVLTIYCGAINAETLAGIEYFTELEELKCEDNSLTELDLSANTKLVYLECQDNAITSLSLEALPDLYYLNCAGNQLTGLDVSQQMLETLNCKDNQLTVLDLSGQALKFLDCQNNPLTLLNLSGQSQLEILNCYGTNLATLDLRGCTQLLNAVQYGTKTSTADYVQYQYVDNKLELILRLRVDASTELIIPGTVHIDAAHFPDAEFRNLIADNFDNNDSGWLSAEEIAAVKDITFEDHDFQTVQGIEFFTELETLCIADAESLTSIDLRSNTKLTVVDVCNNGLTEIRLEGLTSLRELYIYNNSLQALDVSTLPVLERLECDHNPLTSLTLGGKPRLGQLYCYSTSLTSLDISGAQHLIAAWLGTKDGSAAEYDRYTADGYILDVDKNTAIITGIPAPTFILPAALTTIESEAFSGIAAEAVLIPASVISISGDPFAGSDVRYIYGTTELVRNFAEANGYTFVPVRE